MRHIEYVKCAKYSMACAISFAVERVIGSAILINGLDFANYRVAEFRLTSSWGLLSLEFIQREKGRCRGLISC
jgi:hypothetical protein